MLSCIDLTYDAASNVEERIRLFDAGGDPIYAWFEMSWLIPLLMSGDEPRAAVPWSRQLRLATEWVHPWRYADAVSFEFMLATALGHAGPAPLDEISASRNWLASARLLVLLMHIALLRRDFDSTRSYVEQVAAVVPRAAPAVRTTWSGFAALLDAYSIPDRRIAIEIPIELSLLNLGAALASMEAVAISGSQADALRWLQAMRQLLPEGNHTAAEWPVASERMYSLLILRAGDVRGAARAFKAAADWSAHAGFAVESAIARL